MKHIRTHYDNLKVARDAPSEVIRAAYMALSKRFHPDRNPGNADTARVMVLINTSYEVLSDPGKRHAHDQWVAEQERMATWAGEPGRRPNQPAPRPAPTQPQPAPTISAKTFAHIIRNWILYGLAAFFVWALVTDKTGAPPLGPKRYRAIPAPVRPHYVKPTAAPNGNAWPVAAGYVEGYQRLHADGLSTVTVDNSRNDSDVFVKLVSLDDAEAYPVRQFYIPAFGRFALGKLTAGRDDIHYRDLGTGGLSRSEAFGLKETSTADGTQFSNITMTLYKVQNGNMETYGLSEAEF